MPDGLGIIINSEAKGIKVRQFIHFIGYFTNGERNGFGQFSIVKMPMTDIKVGVFTGLNLFEGFILRPGLSQDITECNDHREFIETNGFI